MSAERLVIELALIDGASRVARSAADQLDKLGESGKAVGAKFRGMVDDVNAGMKSLAVSRTLQRELVEPGVRAAATLEDALTGLKVQLDQGSVEQMKTQLRDAQSEAGRIAAPTAFSAAEVVGIQTDLRKAGLGMDTILGQGGAAEAVAKLATAERGLGSQGATQAVMTLGSIFGLQGDQYAGAADLLTRAGGAASVSPGELAAALSMAPSAGTLGLSPDETLASLGVLGNMGIKGSSAGTALNAFLRQAAVADSTYGLGLYDQAGNFKGLGAAAESLRGTMEGRTPQEQQLALQKAFGDEGSRFALALLRTGAGGLEDTQAKMGGALSLDARVTEMAGTLNARNQALSGTADTVLARLFQPALQPLKEMSAVGNDALSRLGQAVDDNPAIAQGVSYGSLAAAGGAAVYGAARLGRGGLRGAQGLLMARRGGLLGSLTGRAAGLAEAKALEKAAGVQPVSVVNWPATLQAGGLAGDALGAAGSGLSSKLRAGAGVLAAGTAGWAVGSAINDRIQENDLAKSLTQGALANAALSSPLTRLGLEATGQDALIAELQRTRNQAMADVGLPPLEIKVSVDKNNQGQAQAVWRDGSAGARAERMVKF